VLSFVVEILSQRCDVGSEHLRLGTASSISRRALYIDEAED
jgi:hypothetical protein